MSIRTAYARRLLCVVSDKEYYHHMPRVSIPITQVTDDGVIQPAQTNGDATNDHQLDFNDGRVILEISTTVSDTVTIITPGVVGSGLAIADKPIVMTGTQTTVAGPVPPAVYNQPAGSVQIDCGVSTTTKFRAYRV
jgi:hypothetical protein